MNALNKISTLLLKVCEERIIFYPEYFNRVDLKYQVWLQRKICKLFEILHCTVVGVV